MKNRNHLSSPVFWGFLLSLLCVVCPLSSGQARTVEKPEDPYLSWEGEPRPWPGNPRPGLSMTRVVEKVEAHNMPRHLLKGAIDLKLGDLFNFQNSNRTLPRYSLYFRHASQPQALLGFSVFDKGEFVKDLSQESLMGYAKALKMQEIPDKRSITIIQGPEQGQDRKAFAFLGAKPVPIIYRLTDKEFELNLQRIEYFLEAGDKHLVVTIESPPELFGGIMVLARQILAGASFSE